MSEWLDELDRLERAATVKPWHPENGDGRVTRDNEFSAAIRNHARELIDATRVKRTQSKTIDILNRERDQYAAERDKLKDEVGRLDSDSRRHQVEKEGNNIDLGLAQAENRRLRELIQEVIEHDETTGWGQNKLAAALKPNEPETKPVAVPAGHGYEAPIAGIAAMKGKP